MQEAPKLLGFYGDDFTGSTDAMEALTMGGIRTILFLEVPSLEMLQGSFADFQAFGIAGVSRSLRSEEMDLELRPAFKVLKDSNALICHYKTCSTFDSSPEIGSIGKAIDIALEVFNEKQTYTPLVVGVPKLKRYTVFGNHFATYKGKVYRLDKHPVMSRHPITPMKEANLINHLEEQTNKSISLIDINEISESINNIRQMIETKKQANDIILFDVLESNGLKKIGQLIWQEARKNSQLFTVGSSGIEYALTEASEDFKKHEYHFQEVGNADQMLVVSGSCSVTTKSQIEYAMKNGFAGIRVDGRKFANEKSSALEIDRLVKQANILLAEGKSVLIYSALGPDDPSIDKVRKTFIDSGYKGTETGKIIGRSLGQVTRKILDDHKLTRLLISGGDTSGYVLKELNIYALQMIKSMTPGAPLCKTYSKNIRFNDISLCLKGGQMGNEDFFMKVKRG